MNPVISKFVLSVASFYKFGNTPEEKEITIVIMKWIARFEIPESDFDKLYFRVIEEKYFPKVSELKKYFSGYPLKRNNLLVNEDRFSEDDIREIMGSDTWGRLGIITKAKLLIQAGMDYKNKEFYKMDDLHFSANQTINQLKMKGEWESTKGWVKSFLEGLIKNG